MIPFETKKARFSPYTLKRTLYEMALRVPIERRERMRRVSFRLLNDATMIMILV